MTYISCVIESATDPFYKKLAEVFFNSVAHHNPEATLISLEETRTLIPPKYEATTTAVQYAAALAPVISDVLIIADADMLQTAPITDDDLNGKWEIAVTIRDSSKPLNSGLVIAKPTEYAYEFLSQWARVSRDLIREKNRPLYTRYAQRYGGSDQAALGWMLEHWDTCSGLIKELPCSIWNLTQTEWEHFEPGVSKFVHMKSKLHKVLSGQKRSLTQKENQILREWESHSHAGP